MSKKRIGILIGSLRAGSYSKKLALYLEERLRPQYDVFTFTGFTLPFYNEDSEAEPPSEWLRFRDDIASLDALLIVTPEYNRSIPASLKNMLDVASRPYNKNLWSGKPGAVVSVSVGKPGGMAANLHMRQIAACLNIPLMCTPEVYLGGINTVFDQNGSMISEGTVKFIDEFLEKYLGWISTFT